MGCLNSEGQFEHWFGNIHFSGPCNRACYFCIGQHMPGLDTHNNLGTWPLPGMAEFLAELRFRGVREVNLTGSDTDPLLYQHLRPLAEMLRTEIPGLVLGLRTNGIAARDGKLIDLFDKVSVSITTFDPETYKRTMGRGHPPDLRALVAEHPRVRFKVNIVLCPEALQQLEGTLRQIADCGVTTVNLREPYGQPHVGDPLAATDCTRTPTFGMPTYRVFGMDVTYWDVHYVEVESVNLYANGIVSTTYPVTAGHDPDVGRVQDQSHFSHGRSREQWANKLKVIA